MSKFRLSTTLKHVIVNLNQQGKKPTERFSFCDGFLFSVLYIIILTILCIQLLTNFQNSLGKKLNKIDWLGVNTGF